MVQLKGFQVTMSTAKSPTGLARPFDFLPKESNKLPKVEFAKLLWPEFAKLWPEFAKL
jgi:hypothetical protein